MPDYRKEENICRPYSKPWQLGLKNSRRDKNELDIDEVIKSFEKPELPQKEKLRRRDRAQRDRAKYVKELLSAPQSPRLVSPVADYYSLVIPDERATFGFAEFNRNDVFNEVNLVNVKGASELQDLLSRWKESIRYFNLF